MLPALVAIITSSATEKRVIDRRCEICGESTDLTRLGSRLCPSCQVRYRQFDCRRCGQRCLYLAELAAGRPELVAEVCSLCHLAERTASLTQIDRNAILAASGTLAAINEVMKRLGLSVGDASYVVRVLRGSAERGAAADRGP